LSSNSRNPELSSAPEREICFLSLFPEVFPPILGASLAGRAERKGITAYRVIPIRDFAEDKHRTADDTPYGGGEGMVMTADVLYAAWKSAREPEGRAPIPKERSLTILLSPQGERFDQAMAKELQGYDQLILVCGHYEGVDERFIELCVDRQVSIGDYVLTGGELPALVIADCITRLRPGVVGNPRSLTEETFENDLLKYPQYTRPKSFQGLEVPEILQGGDHRAIARWRQEHREERTRRQRPDLWQKYCVAEGRDPAKPIGAPPKPARKKRKKPVQSKD
jgi:tRNA (guanine37-N1)-methyltransferase